MKYPKFEEAMKDKVVRPEMMQNNTAGMGMIAKYDRETNKATVALARPGSEMLGEVFPDVPCPVNIGVQGVYPEVGMLCWVVFRDGVRSSPVVVAYFNPTYYDNDFEKQTIARHDLPRFMMDM